MARWRGKINPNAYYHVVTRGNNRRNIYSHVSDMTALLNAFLYVHNKYPFKLIAFCFMTNHYHILIQTPDGNLSKIMGMINRRYSEYYRRRYRHIGRIYQKPFWSKEMDSMRGILDVSAYIHRNPIQTTRPMVEHLVDYVYSSFPCYVNSSQVHPDFLDLSYLPNLFKPSGQTNQSKYVRYVMSKEFFAEEDQYVGDEDCEFAIQGNEKGAFQKLLIRSPRDFQESPN